MRIWKLLVLVGILTQFFGHPPTMEYVGWDYCTEEGHAFELHGYKFGFPVPFFIMGLMYGCLTTPHTSIQFLGGGGLIFDVGFWFTVFWIASKLPEEYQT